MRVIIQSIPHKDQRYETVGDWQWMKDGTLLVKVSDTGSEKMNALLALHEMVEALSCQWDGVSETQVDEWDVAYSEEADDEPGNHPLCPYHKQHFLAENVERVVAREWEVDWSEYGGRLEKLFERGEEV